MDRKSIELTASISTGFTGEAANDSDNGEERPDLLPHEHLRLIMDAEIAGFIRDFRLSMTSILQELNQTNHLTQQSGMIENQPIDRETRLETKHLDIAIGQPFQKLLWRIVITSYRDHLLKLDQSRFCTIHAPMGEEALEFFLKTGRYRNPEEEEKAALQFSHAYIQDLKAFSVIQDLMRQNINGINVRVEMREPENGWLVPIMVVTPQDDKADLRILLKRYIESSAGRDRHVMKPVV